MIWAGQLFLFGFWLFSGAGGMGLLTESGPVGIVLLALGIVATGVGVRSLDLRASRSAGAWALIAFPAAFVFPFPFNVPPLVLSMAGALWLLRPGSRIAIALGGAGGILLLQEAIVSILPWISSRVHEVAPLGAVLQTVATLAGLDASFHSGSVFLRSASGIHAFRPTTELLGLWPILAFAASGLAIAGRRWPRFLCLGTAYLTVRLSAGLMLYLDEPTMDWFTHPWFAFGGLTVFSLILAALLPARSEGITVDAMSTERPSLAPAALLFLAAALGVSALAIRPPGDRKPGRILLDEAHSNWEWSEDRLSKELYGEKTVYNYFCMADDLARRFARLERNREALSASRLAACDVLILKTPTRPFAPAEIRAVHEFVRSGGGLWLIGDHTDVMGMGTHLNAVSREFKIEYVPDSVCGLREPWQQPYRPPGCLRHPVVQQMRPMIFATSCSLQCGPGVWPVIVSNDTFGDDIDYGIENFVADMKPSPKEAFGSFVQCAAARYGRGRVVAFADSTLFSNFFYYLPGIRELALGSVEWLNRTESSGGLRTGLAGGAVLAMIGGILLARRRRTASFLNALPCVLSGVALAIAVTDATARIEPPRPHTPATTIAFDFDRPTYRMALTEQTPAFHPDSYHTFFVWTQRLGYAPRLCASYREGLDADGFVLIEPGRARDPELLRRYVEQGGKVLVLEDPDHSSDAANEILKWAGLSLGEPEEGDKFKWKEREGVRIARFRPVRGGSPRLTGTRSGAALVASVRIGKGIVAACGASRIFTVAWMGETGTVPDETQSSLYGLEYWLFEDVLGLRQP